jgi:hypothetical protein
MQNLQEPYPLGLYGKSLIWRVGTQFSWLESYTVTANSLPLAPVSEFSSRAEKANPKRKSALSYRADSGLPEGVRSKLRSVLRKASSAPQLKRLPRKRTKRQ